MLKQLKYIWILVVAVSIGFTSCKDILDVEPSEVLLQEQVYNNKYDAEVAVRGIYGQFYELAEQLIVLNELRADLMDITENSNQDLRDINEHNVSADNKYADPLAMYTVINSCNDALVNFLRMKEEKSLLETDFSRLYSEVGAMRSYVYLQLAMHFGEIPYVTDPILDYTDLADKSKFPVKNLQEVIVALIAFMESDNISLDKYVDESMNDFTSVIYINKYFLLGDLYLWNNQYFEAASTYKTLMELYDNDDTYKHDRYRVRWAEVKSHDDLNVGYIRYRGDDVLSLITDKSLGWRSIFTRTGGKIFEDEWIWAMPYESTFNTINPFIGLFANEGEGEYLVGPSQQIIDYWNAQIQLNQIPFDARRELSFREINGQNVITKFIENYDALTPFDRSGNWYINRAALLHLRYAEAANRDNEMRIAYALLNNGISAEYDVEGAKDITYLQRTNLPFPYDFDGRKDDTNIPQIPVGIRGSWHRNVGVRGRANLQVHVLDTISPADSVAIIETQLIEEAALELAFEGHRWSDLVRIATRNNDPMFLADKIADKLEKSGNANAEKVRAKLSDPENWFLPFPTKEE